MIDLHCHILPGMDDGPGSLEEALEMCTRASADGIRTIVATPHFNPGLYEFSGAEIHENAKRLELAATREGLDLRIIPAAEVTFSPEIISCPGPIRHLTINNNGRYFLMEFRPSALPFIWDKFISAIPLGMVPVIAHPERNSWFIAHPDFLLHAVGMGMMVQITAMSIAGDFGNKARDFSAYLLRNNLVHAIASDAHSADLRPAILAEAVGIASDLVGSDRARALVTSIPEAIIEGRKIPESAVYESQGRGAEKKLFRRLFSY